VIKFCAIADRGGGGTRRAPPTNGRGPMILYAPDCFSIYFRLLRLQFILNIIFIEICPKHSKDDFKNPPLTLTKSTAPVRSNPGPAPGTVCYICLMFTPLLTFSKINTHTHSFVEQNIIHLIWSYQLCYNIISIDTI